MFAIGLVLTRSDNARTKWLENSEMRTTTFGFQSVEAVVYLAYTMLVSH